MKIFYFTIIKTSFLFILMLFQSSLAFQISDPPAEPVEHRIDIRPVYYYVNTTERDAEQYTEKTFNLRARYGIRYHISDHLTFQGRAAMRLSNTQGDFRFLLEDHTGGSGIYPAGSIQRREYTLKITGNLLLHVGVSTI
jgi:hypothetical protein